MRLSALPLAALILAAAPRAFADGPPSDHGFSFGLRTGFAWPAGQTFGSSVAFVDAVPGASGSTPLATSNSFGDRYAGMVPLWFDAGYRVMRSLYLGAFFQYGFALRNCPSGSSCSGEDFRVGLELDFHLRPSANVDPWFGVGFGYEVLTSHGTGPSAADPTVSTTVDQSLTGVELASLHLGLDLRAWPRLPLGPFLSATFGQFTSLSSTTDGNDDCASGTVNCKLTPHAVHVWIMLGVKAHYDL